MNRVGEKDKAGSNRSGQAAHGLQALAYLFRANKSAIGDSEDSSRQICVTLVHFRIYSLLAAVHFNSPRQDRLYALSPE